MLTLRHAVMIGCLCASLTSCVRTPVGSRENPVSPSQLGRFTVGNRSSYAVLLEPVKEELDVVVLRGEEDSKEISVDIILRSGKELRGKSYRHVGSSWALATGFSFDSPISEPDIDRVVISVEGFRVEFNLGKRETSK